MSQEEKIKIGKQLDEAISKYDSLILDKILDGAQKNKPPYKITEVDYLKLLHLNTLLTEVQQFKAFYQNERTQKILGLLLILFSANNRS